MSADASTSRAGEPVLDGEIIPPPPDPQPVTININISTGPWEDYGWIATDPALNWVRQILDAPYVDGRLILEAAR